MLDHLRQRVAATFGGENVATLATRGPAGLLANVLPCSGTGHRLYLLLPRTSDHLLNLEVEPLVVVATDRWQAWGYAHELHDPMAVALPCTASREARWYTIVEFEPRRVDIAHDSGWGAAETIDLE